MVDADTSPDVPGWVFWAKSDAGGQPHSLWAHLLDTGAVAELVWKEYLSPHAQAALDDCSGGHGRELLALAAAWHDLGKASPAFQSKQRSLLAQQEARGLCSLAATSPRYLEGRHAALSGIIADDVLGEGSSWFGAVLAGHHGRFDRTSSRARLRGPRAALGDTRWGIVQRRLALDVAHALGVDPHEVVARAPSRGVQLALAGYVSMCDWIASSDLFQGTGLQPTEVADARKRAQQAWSVLGIERGWGSALDAARPFEEVFGFSPRPLQDLVAAAARRGPGLMIVEAPMGEGKTEAAFAAIEQLSRVTRASGFALGMPTQATTDAMFDRVRAWTAAVDAELPVALLHGKAMLNEQWERAVAGRRLGEIYDEFGLADDGYGLSTGGVSAAGAPSAWLLGRHRQLLAPAVVGTVDQLLGAATRAKFVALRHAGLLGRVVVIDEVHSYDAYMGVFLHELLRWCARLRTPVVLMSATLAPGLRRALVAAWREGASLAPEMPTDVASLAYPLVMSCHWDGSIEVETCPSRNPRTPVEVTLLPTSNVDDVTPIAEALQDEVADGGCALAILNTVRRAQEVYQALADTNAEVLLLHGRFTVAERARRAKAAITQMGTTGPRPTRLIVVATQIAEQSFDVDADVLYTDIAPMDLLLQRIGRLHRHAGRQRPERHRSPRVVVTGLATDGACPRWPQACAEPADADQPTREPRTVYRPLPLLAAASAIGEGTTWFMPDDIPRLVAEAYGDTWQGAAAWKPLADRAREVAAAEERVRQERAATFRLDQFVGQEEPTTLEGLHDGLGLIDAVRSVRDGDDGVEVCLVVRSGHRLSTLGGRDLGSDGERAADPALARQVLGDAVRLRWAEDVPPLPQWTTLPLLEGMPVVVLAEDLTGTAGHRKIRYDRELGLVDA